MPVYLAQPRKTGLGVVSGKSKTLFCRFGRSDIGFGAKAERGAIGEASGGSIRPNHTWLSALVLWSLWDTPSGNRIVSDPPGKARRRSDKTLWYLHVTLSSTSQASRSSKQGGCPQPASKPPQCRKGVLGIAAHSKPKMHICLQILKEYAFIVLKCVRLPSGCSEPR